MKIFNISPRASFVHLLIAQALVTFNDNAAKLMLFGLGTLVLSAERAATATNLIAFLLLAPFVILSPLAGWIADRFSKSLVLKVSLFAQLGCLFVIGWALQNRHFYGALVGFALLAVQSAFLAPAKQGVLKELVGSKHLGVAVGWMELLTIVAILTGSFAGGFFFDYGTQRYGDPWTSASLSVAYISLSAILSFLIIVRDAVATPIQTREPFRLKIILSHFHDLVPLWQKPSSRAAALGVAWFYTTGGFLLLALMQLSRELQTGAQPGAAGTTGLLILILGLGIVVGSLLAVYLNRQGIELGLAPLGVLIMLINCTALGLSQPLSELCFMSLLGLGLGGALFTVPLQALVHKDAGDDRRGRTLAAANLLSNIGGVAVIGLHWIVGRYCSASEQFLLLSASILIVALYVINRLYYSFFRVILKVILHCIYRVHILGRHHIPREGGALLMSNHISYIDPILIAISTTRPVRFIGDVSLGKSVFFRLLSRKGIISFISIKSTRQALNQGINWLKAGEIVCIFPEGKISQNGLLGPLKRGFILLAKQGRAPVIPVILDGLWGSFFSFSGGRFRKRSQRHSSPVRVSFGKPLPFQTLTLPSAHQALIELGEQAFRKRPTLRKHLADLSIRALSRRPRRTLVIDHTTETPRSLSAGMLLALSHTLARKWHTTLSEQRIGIALPPGIGSFIANLAVMLAGKTSVNLNLTVSRASARSMLDRAGVTTIVTAPALRERFPNFPWTTQTQDISHELSSLPRSYLLVLRTAIAVLPGAVLSKLFRAPRKGDNAEAALLFSSGSSGDPKGIPLTHRNLIANLIQINESTLLPKTETLLASLPIFHSFGLTVSLWYPILYRLKTVTTPSPLEPRKIAQAIQNERATVLVGTPTFFRPYFKKVKPETLSTLKYVIAGSEKTPEGFGTDWERHFHSHYLEGYGLTETSPAVACNLPIDGGLRRGSVGRLVPGMAARIGDPETGQPLPTGATGVLYLKGANVFNGYLNDIHSTEAAFDNGWFRTGDLARFDADGFLYIEGRLSRFSKIGGEMVPHGVIETAITKAYGLTQAELPVVAVTARPDPNKGEALVLLTTFDINTLELRAKLSTSGLPNLWIPRELRRVRVIPLLPSGKLDLKACRAEAGA